MTPKKKSSRQNGGREAEQHEDQPWDLVRRESLRRLADLGQHAEYAAPPWERAGMPHDLYQALNSLTIAIGNLGEQTGDGRHAFAAQALEGIRVVLENADSQKASELLRSVAAQCRSAAGRTRPELPDPGHKVPVMARLRAGLADLLKRLPNESSEQHAMFLAHDVGMMTFGESHRIFGAGDITERSQRWTSIIEKCRVRTRSPDKCAVAILKAIARKEGYKGRLAELFPDG